MLSIGDIMATEMCERCVQHHDTITSQRGSAWQCYIGRWLSKGKPAFFPPVGLEKPMEILKPIFGTGDNVGETYKHAKFG